MDMDDRVGGSFDGGSNVVGDRQAQLLVGQSTSRTGRPSRMDYF